MKWRPGWADSQYLLHSRQVNTDNIQDVYTVSTAMLNIVQTHCVYGCWCCNVVYVCSSSYRSLQLSLTFGFSSKSSESLLFIILNNYFWLVHCAIFKIKLGNKEELDIHFLTCEMYICSLCNYTHKRLSELKNHCKTKQINILDWTHMLLI